MNTEIDLTARDARSAELFRLLSPPLPSEPFGEPLRTEIKGHWEVEIFDSAVRWTCRCRRSEPFLMRPKEIPHILFPPGLIACEVCRHELQQAATKWERLDAWLERSRYTLDSNECLQRDDAAKPNPRLLRRVYERFWRTSITPSHCVKSICSNRNCINPHHLCLVKTAASRLTTESENFLNRVLLAGVSTDTARQLLREKHSIELSTRSIQRIRRDLSKSRSCVI